MSDYPQHELVKAHKDRAMAAGDFLSWLEEEKHYHLAAYGDLTDRPYPVSYNIERLLAEWIGVDYDEFQREKERMLDDIRAAYAAREKKE